MFARILASCDTFDRQCHPNALLDALVIGVALLAAVGLNLWWFWYRKRGR
jgi:hypothetical protein